MDFNGISSEIVPLKEKSDRDDDPDSDSNSPKQRLTLTAQGCRNAAAQGDVKTIKKCMKIPNHKELLSSTDENGWQA
jgi:hypothetical protein